MSTHNKYLRCNLVLSTWVGLNARWITKGFRGLTEKGLGFNCKKGHPQLVVALMSGKGKVSGQDLRCSEEYARKELEL